MSNIIHEILTDFNTIKKLNEEFKKVLLTEAPYNTNHILGNNPFQWGAGPSDHQKRAIGNWSYDRGWDLIAPKGTPVYAIEGGQVTNLTGDLTQKDMVFGYSVTVENKDDSFFYTHLESRNPNLRVGSQIKKGDYVGTIGQPQSNPQWQTRLHVGVKNNEISKYLNGSGIIQGYKPTSQQTTSSGTTTSNVTTNSDSKYSSGVPKDTFLTGIGQEIGSALNLDSIPNPIK